MNEMDQVLPFGLTADGVLVTLVAAMAFLSVWAVWYALLEKHPMERRARMLAARRNELRGQMLKDKGPRTRHKEGLSMMRQVVAVLKLMQTQQTDRLHDKLSQAGLRSRDSVIVFLFFKAAMPVLLAAVTFLAVYLLEVGDLAPTSRLLAVLGGAALGFFVPELYVNNLVKKRQLLLARALPDGLDLLVICAESPNAASSQRSHQERTAAAGEAVPVEDTPRRVRPAGVGELARDQGHQREHVLQKTGVHPSRRPPLGRRGHQASAGVEAPVGLLVRSCDTGEDR
jgi:tight adherence protein C